MQSEPDLNLLVLLDAILAEGSVTGAARRLNLSVPAASRGLTRARRMLGDPIMVRAGRGLVPTPRALALQGRVHEIVTGARLVVNDTVELDLSRLQRDFLVISNELLFPVGPLIARVHQQAPRATCSFIPITDPTASLRESPVDLFIGVTREFDPVAQFEPEVMAETIREDRLIGICRSDHPLLKAGMTKEKYLAAEHLVNSRRGRLLGPIDHELATLGLGRRVVASAATLWSTLVLLLESDLLGGVSVRAGKALERFGLSTFEIPFEFSLAVEVRQAWHPRHNADPAHIWFRELVRALAAAPE